MIQYSMSGHDSSRSPSQDPRPIKRIRTRRACDECRFKKIRCQYPAGRQAVGSCAHCELHGLTCEAVAPPPAKNPRTLSHTDKGRGDNSQDVAQGEEPLFLGSTSITGIVTSIPANGPPQTSKALDDLDRQYDHFRFTSRSTGEQFVLASTDDEETAAIKNHQYAKHSNAEARVASQIVSESVLESLVALYRRKIVPVFPVISISESASLFPWIRTPNINSTPPTPLPRLLRLLICSVPAQWRSVPKDVRQSLRVTLLPLMEGEPGRLMTRSSSLGNLQSLLSLYLSREVLPTSKRESWLNVGLAIRMAQEIGLHRDIPVEAVPTGQRNRRKRVWAACQVSDAWYAAMSGLPPLIDPLDCDVGPPQEYPDHCSAGQPGQEEPCFATHVHMWKLSLILTRIVKGVYSPMGLERTTDSALYEIMRDLSKWESELPSETEAPSFGEFDMANLKFLTLVSVAVEALLVRAFLHPARPIPPSITFRPSPARWDHLVSRAAEAIKWISNEGVFLLDVWHIIIYALTLCALIQFEAFLATGDAKALQHLLLADGIAREWAKASDGTLPRHRAKTAAQIGILVIAAKAHRPENVIVTANPTPPFSSSALGDHMSNLVNGNVFPPVHSGTENPGEYQHWRSTFDSGRLS
ncbi:hypothetical protein BCR39DRAFT_540169 [Naematelia encephala]|uniref:Zn(2)-C6 fungal-type domain-containing protein n=1 Tax=Naematelia encephala TaxID=71784 RepID=A0A1Y2AW04_9TREE|nr:hypothetical protein BCR39DRAFT_540169 [Naematelia encephala]